MQCKTVDPIKVAVKQLLPNCIIKFFEMLFLFLPTELLGSVPVLITMRHGAMFLWRKEAISSSVLYCKMVFIILLETSLCTNANR